ncbi:MAG: acyl-CoA dehydrogenase, partial [Xanthomonadaceae bacterium]|nr:acyl-CoA dehydrogenase [Xanthomonadaceae bacterium]
MNTLIILVCAAVVGMACAYFRSRLWHWTLATIVTILVVGFGLHAPTPMWVLLGIFLVLVALPLNVTPLRRGLFAAPLLNLFERVLPKISETEQVAL